MRDPNSDMRCSSCLYSNSGQDLAHYLRNKQDYHGNGTMVCMRYPPKVIGKPNTYGGTYTSLLPLVSENDYCGEWKPGQ